MPQGGKIDTTTVEKKAIIMPMLPVKTDKMKTRYRSKDVIKDYISTVKRLAKIWHKLKTRYRSKSKPKEKLELL